MPAVKPVVLIVLDGVGHNPDHRGNAVLAAHTPHMDAFRETYPGTLLGASGEAVGLPAGYQGSSEVGHLNMGAGRVIPQELKRIDDGLSAGSLFKLDHWTSLIADWKSNNSRLHLLGLLQDEGVHAHQEHLFKIMRRVRQENPTGDIILHPFLDGRDTPPRSCREFLSQLRRVMEAVGGCSIGTLMGRYYGMDRARNWALTDQAYTCLVQARGRPAQSAEEAVQASYDNDRTPDNVAMFDEYIPPHFLNGYQGVKDGDCLIHTNYRQDRAIQLSRAFVDPAYPGHLEARPQVTYLGLTRYYDEFENYLLADLGSSAGMENLVGEVIARAGLRQLRITETQKFRHVTSFFNGKSTTPFPNEDQVEIKSRFDPATFASHPEMEAYNITAELLRRLSANQYAFILLNYANGDMVGHTGDFEAAKKALAVVDECLGRVIPRVLELDGQVLLTSDHGNSDQMIDYETGEVRTSHSIHPVDCFYIAREAPGQRLVPRGKLADIGPTILKLLDLPIPEEMTARVLIQD